MDVRVDYADVLIGYFAAYKGYTGTIEYNYEDNIYYGHLTNIRDSIYYEEKSVEEMYKSFKNAVDDYIEFCKANEVYCVCGGEKCSKRESCKKYTGNIRDNKTYQYIDFSTNATVNYIDGKRTITHWCGDASENYPSYERYEKYEEK